MIVLAHIMAMPVEEVLVPLASGAGAGTMIWLAALLRRAAQRLSAADFLKRRWNVPLDADKVGAAIVGGSRGDLDDGVAAIGVTGEDVEPLG